VQKNMEVLQGALLHRILEHVHDCKLLLQCSAVSKAWHAAVCDSHPTSLWLPHSRNPVTPAGLILMIQWLQRQKSPGFLQRLEVFHWFVPPACDRELTAACYEADLLGAFLHSSLAHVNFWNLHTVDLAGPLQLESVVPMLPTTLLHLRLVPYASRFPRKCSLDMFNRFSHLKSLTLYPYDMAKTHIKGSFVLVSPLPMLENLSLDPWCLKTHKDYTFVQMLPRAQHVAVNIPANKAHSLLAIQSLKYLALILHDIPKPIDFGARVPRIIIERDLQLRHLLLAGPPATPFRLDVADRPDHLHIAQYDAGKKGSSCLIGQPSTYCPPKQFDTLEWHFEDCCRWY